MKKFSLLLLFLLNGCDRLKQQEIGKGTYYIYPSTITVSFDIIKTPELIEELQSQQTIDDQFSVLYKQFGKNLDRYDSLTGIDSNNDGIRDDIEVFINTLEVTAEIRHALKQDARQAQEVLSHDFTEDTQENIQKALEISDKYLRAFACKGAVGINIDDNVNTSSTITTLTYNTKERTMAHIAFNRYMNDSVKVLLPEEMKYCEILVIMN